MFRVDPTIATLFIIDTYFNNKWKVGIFVPLETAVI